MRKISFFKSPHCSHPVVSSYHTHHPLLEIWYRMVPALASEVLTTPVEMSSDFASGHRVISAEADGMEKKCSTKSVSALLNKTIHDIAKTAMLAGQSATHTSLEGPMTIGHKPLNGLAPCAVWIERSQWQKPVEAPHWIRLHIFCKQSLVSANECMVTFWNQWWLSNRPHLIRNIKFHTLNPLPPTKCQDFSEISTSRCSARLLLVNFYSNPPGIIFKKFTSWKFKIKLGGW